MWGGEVDATNERPIHGRKIVIAARNLNARIRQDHWRYNPVGWALDFCIIR